MRKYIFTILLLVLLSGNFAKAEELPYENYNLTNSRFENTVSMERNTPIYRDDITNKVFKPTKKELKQAEKLYKKLTRVKKGKKITITSKEYKNLTRLMGIINEKYFHYVSLSGTVMVDKYYIYEIYGSTVKQQIQYNTDIEKRYQNIIKELGINKNTTEHDAILLINNYIMDYVKYDFNSDEDVERYQDHAILYTKISICGNYADMFYELANICGLKCGVVIDDNMKHAYNIVYVGGKPTYIDVCWNDCLHENIYIFMTKEEILKSHGITRIRW